MYHNLTLRQKDKIAKTIYKNYRNAQLDLLFLNQHYNYYPSVDMFKIKESGIKQDQQMLNQLEKKKRLEDYVEVIDHIHHHLSKDHLAFIENEYLNHYDTNWWMYLYSRATYYRLKHDALNEFIEQVLEYFNENDVQQFI